jgi:hypothetical protein
MAVGEACLLGQTNSFRGFVGRDGDNCLRVAFCRGSWQILAWGVIAQPGCGGYAQTQLAKENQSYSRWQGY